MEIFKDITADPQKHAEILRRPPAQKNVVIFFTPRSGSSWLTDILAQTGRFGAANELFNPNFMPSIARTLHATSLDDYVAASCRRFEQGNVFSFEITGHQMSAVFEGHDDFFTRFGSFIPIWLVREDIVAQAVSLAKMVSAGVSHSPSVNPGMVEKADLAFRYDPSEIKRWLLHIRKAETITENYFAAHDIRPIRMTYETMTENGATVTAERLLDLVDSSLPMDTVFESRHVKIGTSQNDEFARKFRRQKWWFLRSIYRQRAEMRDQKNPS